MFFSCFCESSAYRLAAGEGRKDFLLLVLPQLEISASIWKPPGRWLEGTETLGEQDHQKVATVALNYPCLYLWGFNELWCCGVGLALQTQRLVRLCAQFGPFGCCLPSGPAGPPVHFTKERKKNSFLFKNKGDKKSNHNRLRVLMENTLLKVREGEETSWQAEQVDKTTTGEVEQALDSLRGDLAADRDTTKAGSKLSQGDLVLCLSKLNDQIHSLKVPLLCSWRCASPPAAVDVSRATPTGPSVRCHRTELRGVHTSV